MTTLKQLIDSQALASAPFAELVAAQDYQAIAAALNAATTVLNPDAGVITTTTVPVTITLKSLLAIVPAAEAAAIYAKLPGYVTDLKIAIDAGDREYMAGLLAIALAGGAISQPTAVALNGLLNATETVTTTQPVTLPAPSLAVAAGLGTVSAAGVQAALN